MKDNVIFETMGIALGVLVIYRVVNIGINLVALCYVDKILKSDSATFKAQQKTKITG